MTAILILKKARNIVRNKKHWTQGAMVRTAYGVPSEDPLNPDATCWCMEAAMYKAGDVSGIAWKTLMSVLPQETPYIHIFNDHHTHAEVIAKFDEAIAKLEAA